MLKWVLYSYRRLLGFNKHPDFLNNDELNGDGGKKCVFCGFWACRCCKGYHDCRDVPSILHELEQSKNNGWCGLAMKVVAGSFKPIFIEEEPICDEKPTLDDFLVVDEQSEFTVNMMLKAENDCEVSLLQGAFLNKL